MALPPTYLRALEQLSLAFGAYEGETGQPPILVGGAAAAIRTGGQFMSADLDVVAADERAFARAMAATGFLAENRAGKEADDWYHPGFPAYAVDRVSGSYFGGKGDRGRLLRLVVRDYAALVIPSVEDLIADRLGQYATASRRDESRLLQARALLKLSKKIDPDYLVRRIVDEGGDPALVGH
jgi:hypothetical protein